MSGEQTATDRAGSIPSGLDGSLSAALIRQIADHSPCVTLVASASDCSILYANRAAHLAARSAPGELVGRIAAAVFPFVDPTLLATRTQAQAPAVAERRAGATTWWDVSYLALEVPPPEGPAVLIIAADVTPQELAKAQAQTAQDTLAALIACIPEGVGVARGPEAVIEHFSSRGVALSGRKAEAMTGLSALRQTGGWEVYQPGADVPLAPADRPLARAMRTGETRMNETLIVKRPDDSVLTVLCNSAPIRDATGRVTGAVMAWRDVGELQRAQAAIRDTEELLRAVLLQVPAATFILEAPDGHVTFKSRMLDEVLGEHGGDMGRAQATLQGWAIHPDGSPYALSEYPSRRALWQGETVRAEPMAFQRADGRRIDLEMYAGPVHGEAGEIIAAVAVAIDVTERRRAEARLRESEERLRLVMEASGLGVWEYDATTGRTIRSARHDAIFGHAEPLADWSWERFEAHVHREDRDRVERGFRAALEQGEDWNVEFRMIRADGSDGWGQVLARPRHGPDGRVVRLLGAIADVTERKHAADAVMETAAKFEMLAQTLPNMIWTSAPGGEMEWFNARVPEYCGLPADEMKPDGWSPVHPDDLAASTTRWREALASGEPYVAEYRIRRHDGEYRWHITRAIPIRGADGSISRWIGSSADIQDQKSSEEALADLNASLEQQVRDRTAELLAAEATLRQSQKMEAVGQLTGGLAHDFNNLLTGITGSLELMAARLDQGRHAEMRRYLQIAQAEAQRAAALTHRLLAFSRRQTLDPKPTDISELVAGMDELIRRTVGPAVALEVVAPGGLWAVLADPNQLESALLNLCLNARDAMPDGGALTIQTANETLEDPEARALELPAGDYVSLSVSDTGVGMTADVIARAFDPFFTTKPIGQGTGLGLSMVYGFVRQSGGQARILSAPGHGARISLYLPRYAGEGLVVEGAAAVGSAQRGHSQTVLVVDDEPSVRLLIREVLGDLGYHVLEAETGAAALDVMQAAGRVDLLVTDVGLPGGMNGRQLADAALSDRPALKVLFITGYAEKAVIGDGPLQPPLYILTKPFTLEALGARVEQIITAP